MNKKYLVIFSFICTLLAPILFFLYRFLLNCQYSSNGIWSRLDVFITKSSFASIFFFIIFVVLPLMGIILSIISMRKKENSFKLLSGLPLTIGILYFIIIFLVITSLNSSRPKSVYGSAKAFSSQISSFMISDNVNTYFNEKKSFGTTNGTCDTPGTVFQEVGVEYFSSGFGHTAKCFSSQNLWAIGSSLEKKGGLLCEVKSEDWCVDSTGFSGKVNKELTEPSCN